LRAGPPSNNTDAPSGTGVRSLAFASASVTDANVARTICSSPNRMLLGSISIGFSKRVVISPILERLRTLIP
jgi:hypothetical protein